MAKMKLPSSMKTNSQDMSGLSESQFQAVAQYKQRELDIQRDAQQGQIDIIRDSISLGKEVVRLMDSIVDYHKVKEESRARIIEAKSRLEESHNQLEIARVGATTSQELNAIRSKKIDIVHTCIQTVQNELNLLPTDSPERQGYVKQIVALIQSLASMK